LPEDHSANTSPESPSDLRSAVLQPAFGRSFQSHLRLKHSEKHTHRYAHPAQSCGWST